MARTGPVTGEILRRMRAGDREAFDRFFERNAARVLVYINFNLGPRLRSRVDPADILQQLYLKLYEDFATFSRRAAERGIHHTLIRMAAHEISEAYRYHFKADRRDARREVAAAHAAAEASDEQHPMGWIPSPATSITQQVVRQEEYRRVMEMLRELTPLEQYVTVSQVIEGLSSREIADNIGTTPGNVRTIAYRVRDKLRKRAGVGEGGGEAQRLQRRKSPEAQEREGED